MFFDISRLSLRGDTGVRGTMKSLASFVLAALTGSFLTLGCAGDGASVGGPPIASPVEPGPVAMRRLTEPQYRASIEDVLGDGLSIAGRIEPDNRRSGQLAVGSSYVSVTPSGFEQYEAVARSLAEQALAPERRTEFVGCEPSGNSEVDSECSARFLATVGRLLLRRPLGEDEIEMRADVAREAAAALGDFYAGLEVALTTLLVSPEFLFRVEVLEPDGTGGSRLAPLSLATRLSYFLWNTTPDDELLSAAERGDLLDDEGVAEQVDRLLASPRVENSVRAFFSDIYSFDQIEQGLVRKDPALFPGFNQGLIDDAREQTLRVLSAHLLEGDGDYRDVFTTRESFMTRRLGVLYRVPVRSPDGWEPYTFGRDSERGGLLTHPSLLALHSHPGRSSPTLRGKFVREVFLCQYVPPPPGDIDFAMFADDSAADRRTARQRLQAHVDNPACAGCHSLVDPIGLALEQLDGIGAYRTTENGEPIDASGSLNGAAFTDAIGLGHALSRDPEVGPCFVRSLFKYAVGRESVPGEEPFLAELEDYGARRGYRIRDLMRVIAMSQAFRAASGAREADEPAPTAPPLDTPEPTPTELPPDGTPRPPTATRTPAPATATPRVPTLAELQDDIFTPRCASQFCHSQQVRAGGLVLEAGAAWAQMVGVASANEAARQRGWLRVAAGDPDASFLTVKLEGPSEAALGSRMPLGANALTAAEVAAVRQWIAAGANR